MKIPFLKAFYLSLALLLIFQSCTTDFEVNAPYEEIVAVYCVLNPNDTIQYVRVSAGYQTESDALVYAAETDLSLKGLNIKLKQAANEWTAIQLDSFPLDTGGTFFPFQTVYAFSTPSGMSLEEGKTYTLQIGEQDDSLYLTGQTTIPSNVSFSGSLGNNSPGTVPCGFPNQQISQINISKPINLIFKKGFNASAYELRIYFEYEENGNPKEAVWSSLGLIDDNVRCVEGSKQICYQIKEYSLYSFYLNHLGGSGIYTYDNTPLCTLPEKLPVSWRFEVTALDDELRNYVTVNSPVVVDLTGARPEYTNLSGNVRAVGVFGSITSDSEYSIMDGCSEWLLGLNNTPKPVTLCELP